MGRYWAKIAQISDFAGKLQLGFIMRIWGVRGSRWMGMRSRAPPVADAARRSIRSGRKKSSKRAARRFFRAPQGGGGRCACGYLGSVSVRSTDLDFSPQKNLNSYPALQATERGLSRGNLSPLTRFCLLLAVQKEAPAGQAYSLCLCKRLRDAEGDHKLAPAG